jgi:hypothetical protein
MPTPETPGGAPADAPVREDEWAPEPSRPEQGNRAPGGKEQIRQVRDKVVDQAKTSFRQAKDQAAASLNQSRKDTADQIGSLASAVHRAGDHLRNEDQPRVAELANSLASQADKLADYLQSADIRKVGRDIESLARRQPLIVYGSAFALGVLVARFIKSSPDAGSTYSEPPRLVSRASGGTAGGVHDRP